MKIWLKFIPLLLLAILVGCDSGAKGHKEIPPSEFNKRFQPSELKQDIEFLFKTLEEVHPNLYAYAPKEIIDQERKRIESQFSSPLTRRQFYVKIAPLVAKLDDGHTWVGLPWEEIRHYVEITGLLFPFDLDFRDGRAFIVGNYSSDSIFTVGSEVLSVNGMSIQNVVDSLLEFVVDKAVIARMQRVKGNFKWLLQLIYGFDGEYEVEFVSKLTSEQLTQKVNGVTFEAIKTKRGTTTKHEELVYYTYYSLPEERIGIIDFRECTDYEKFKTFLTETFILIQKDSIESLIIDVRKNPGGESHLGDELLTYITEKPFTQSSKVETKISKQIKKFHRSFLPWYRRWLPDWFLKSDPNYEVLCRAPEGSIVTVKCKPIIPQENPLRFNGDVYVLIGPGTYSSAMSFAVAIKDCRLGILIGEETGGLATSYGAAYQFDVPNTYLKAGVSSKYIVRPSGEDDGRGVLPDYEVKESVEDLEKGIDGVMEFTRRLIKSKSTSSRKL